MADTFVKIGATTYSPTDWTFPSDRTFRNAWESAGVDTGIIQVNMDSAREIWRDKIRLARIPVLAALDADFMKALETGADTSAIVAQKQALRDAPADPAIDAATTPEELRKVLPAGLTVE